VIDDLGRGLPDMLIKVLTELRGEFLQLLVY
jgi:hypothetical protein